jgi:hypothetical protein
MEDEKEVKKIISRMLGSEDQLLATLSEYDTNDLLEAYGRICAHVKQMPFREDVDLAKVLVNLGLGRILYIKGTIDKDQTP